LFKVLKVARGRVVLVRAFARERENVLGEVAFLLLLVEGAAIVCI